MYSSSLEEAKVGYKFKVSPITNKEVKLQIKTLQNALRDVDKLEWLSKSKEREKQRQKQCTHRRYTKIVTETEMLKVVLYLVNRNHRQQ